LIASTFVHFATCIQKMWHGSKSAQTKKAQMKILSNQNKNQRKAEVETRER
jgi:hypothetical protein